MSGGKSVKEGKKSKGSLAHRLELLAEAFDFIRVGASGESPELESALFGSGRYRGRNGRVLDRGAHFERGRGPRAQRCVDPTLPAILDFEELGFSQDLGRGVRDSRFSVCRESVLRRRLQGCARARSGLCRALLHGPEQIADLPVPVAESPGAVRIGHPERSHLVEYLAPNSVFNSLPRQRSSPHLRPDDRLVTIDRVLHHVSLGVA